MLDGHVEAAGVEVRIANQLPVRQHGFGGHSGPLAPFARDLGYDGAPFIWDDEDRRHLRARLDALYFHLYGLSRDDAAYVMDTFPIVRREDEKRFGKYRTREMAPEYMNALSAGDTGVRVGV